MKPPGWVERSAAHSAGPRKKALFSGKTKTPRRKAREYRTSAGQCNVNVRSAVCAGVMLHQRQSQETAQAATLLAAASETADSEATSEVASEEETSDSTSEEAASEEAASEDAASEEAATEEAASEEEAAVEEAAELPQATMLTARAQTTAILTNFFIIYDPFNIQEIPAGDQNFRSQELIILKIFDFASASC